jgi:NADH-quinone oxidoreductase subunit M
MNGFDHWVLTLAIFTPAVGAAILILIPARYETAIKSVALATSLVAFGFGVYVFAHFNYNHTSTLQFVVDRSWIQVIHARYHIGVDGLSLSLFGLSLLIVPLCIIYSWDHFPEPHNPKAFLTLIMILSIGMTGTFLAEDLILFFVFFELVLLPMYFMIGVWGGPNRQYASIKFFLFTLFGSALMILSFLALYFKAGNTFQIPELVHTAAHLPHSTQVLIFAGLFMGFAIKVPMFPFHTWLPDAHTEAPTVGSVILAAVLLKLGTYGFVRIALPILPKAAETWAPWIGLLAVIGIIYGALACLAQRDVKRLIAYSSVAHMGFVMLGIATLSTYGINAAVFGMVAHGLITGMLFFCAGSIQERFDTREISRLGGMLKQVPRLAWILGFCAFASLGLPGLAGFWGEFPAILASYSPALGLSIGAFRTYMVVAAIGTVFAAGYLLWMYQRTAFGNPKSEFDHEHFHDVHVPEWLAWAPMLVLILVLGIVPNLIFRQTEGPVKNNVTAGFVQTGQAPIPPPSSTALASTGSSP